MAVGFEHLFMYGFAQLAVSWMSLEFFNKYHHPFLPIYQILPAKNIKNFTDQQSVRRCFYLVSFLKKNLNFLDFLKKNIYSLTNTHILQNIILNAL